MHFATNWVQNCSKNLIVNPMCDINPHITSRNAGHTRQNRRCASKHLWKRFPNMLYIDDCESQVILVANCREETASVTKKCQKTSRTMRQWISKRHLCSKESFFYGCVSHSCSRKRKMWSTRFIKVGCISRIIIVWT